MLTKKIETVKIKRVDIFCKAIMPLVFSGMMSGYAIAYAKSSLYTQGQSQLDNKKWGEAKKTFKKMLKEKSKKSDAALYWLAYAEFKSGQNQFALKSIKRLIKAFPESSWIDDAKALKVEIRDKRGETELSENDELKLYAIDSLMNAPAEKALKIVGRILKQDNSVQIKKRALFVLSQIDERQSFSLIAKMAKEETDDELRKHAIHILGISGTEQASKQLKKIYNSSTSSEDKGAILESMMITGNSQEVIQLVHSENDPELKGKAIRLVGVMSETKPLLSLYRNEKFSKFREDILEGIAVGEGVDELLKIIQVEKNTQLQVKAIELLGVTSSKKSGEKLLGLYREHNDVEVRSAIIKALFIQSNTKGLISLVKSEKNSELKKEALRMLTLIDSDEATSYFDNILSGVK